MKPRIAILISGGGSNMISLVKSINANKINAVAAIVISNCKDANGLKRAKDLSVPSKLIDQKNIDIICLAGFMKILTKSFIDKWNNRILNIHPSLLPKYKGLNTHQRAIDASDNKSGCSVHIVTAELDGGMVLGQKFVNIDKNDTAQSLSKKVLIEEHKLYPEVLNKFIRDLDK